MTEEKAPSKWDDADFRRRYKRGWKEKKRMEEENKNSLWKYRYKLRDIARHIQGNISPFTKVLNPSYITIKTARLLCEKIYNFTDELLEIIGEAEKAAEEE